jgi:hypothetical protein
MNKQQNSKVQAYVSVNKNRLKIYEDNKYYLSNGTNFEIELVNNDNKKYLVEIYLNEQSIGSIIIGANSHNYLERYIDNNRKFQLNTFDIDDVDETKEAQERNGSIQIYFYPQISLNHPSFEGRISSTNNLRINDTPRLYNLHEITTGSPVINYYSTTSDSLKSCYYNTITSCSSSIETGRINEGENSNQTFTYSSDKFEDRSTHSLDYQILPISLKPYEGIKTYCSECGTKIRHKNWKYCINCGTKL